MDWVRAIGTSCLGRVNSDVLRNSEAVGLVLDITPTKDAQRIGAGDLFDDFHMSMAGSTMT
jgi:hypothetical protein